MKRQHKSAVRFVLISILCITFLLACSLGDRAKAETMSSEEYAQYREAARQMQKEFDMLTDRLFQEEVVKNTINLHYTLSTPENFGILDYPITFGDFSLDSMKEDMAELKKLNTVLETFEDAKLRADQQVTYRILHSYANTELESEGLELYYQPLGPTIGVQAQLPILLSEYTFYRTKDVEDYLRLLSLIDDYYAEIMEFEKEKAAAGLFMSAQSVDHIIESCESFTVLPDDNFMTTTFKSRLEQIPDMTESLKNDYVRRHEEILRSDFLTAYQTMISGLKALRDESVKAQGLSALPEGKRYYEYLVNSSTGTSYPSVNDLKNAIKKQLNSDLTKLSGITKEYPDSLEELDSYQFSLSDPVEIMEDLKLKIQQDFPDLPPCTYDIKYVPKTLEDSLSPAFYLTPPLDLYDKNVVYINGHERYKNEDLYTTLAHEGYPGHLYQTVYFTHNLDCNLRQLLSFSSYSEGWASYVEYFSYGFDNGLSEPLGKLLAHNSAATLALHALLDIEINYNGWSQQQTYDYLKVHYGIEDPSVASDMYFTLIENPTNYLEYYVGYLEIINMRDDAMKALGENYDSKKFHTFLLDLGPAPFTVIRPYFQSWLLSSNLSNK